MKYAYPIVITYEKDSSGVDYLVYIPDFAAHTQGESIPNAIEMGQDVVALMAWEYEEDEKELPNVSDLTELREMYPDATVTLVAVDTEEYRKRCGNKAVKKTLSLPAWLNTKAEDAGVNFSQVLQEALREKLAL